MHLQVPANYQIHELELCYGSENIFAISGV
jgi:hypothetical protein